MTTSYLLTWVLPLILGGAEAEEKPEEAPLAPLGMLELPRTIEPQEEPPVPVAEDAEPKFPHWSGSFNIGLDYATGNNENLTFTGTAEVERRGENDRWTAKGFGNYLRTQGVMTQRTYGGSLQYDYYLTKKVFLYASGGAMTDFAAMLTIRYAISAGAGYQFYEEEKFKLRGNAGVGYLKREFFNNSFNESVTADLGYNLEWKATENSIFAQELTYLPSVEDKDNYYVLWDTRYDVNLTKNLISRIQWIFQYDSMPAPGASKTDNQIIFSLGWAFGK